MKKIMLCVVGLLLLRSCQNEQSAVFQENMVTERDDMYQFPDDISLDLLEISHGSDDPESIDDSQSLHEPDPEHSTPKKRYGIHVELERDTTNLTSLSYTNFLENAKSI